MGSPMPVGGVAAEVFAAPFKGTAPNAAVALAIEMRRRRASSSSRRTAPSTSRVEVAFTATDANGKVVPRRPPRAWTSTLKPDTLRAREGARLPRGDAGRPAARPLPAARRRRRRAPARAGSVLYDLEVPDFYKAPLTMSGVALTSARGRRGADRPAEGSARRLPARPADHGARVRARRRAGALRRVLRERAGRAGAHARHQGRAARRGRPRRAREHRRAVVHRAAGRPAATAHGARCRSTDLEPGLYVLRVEGQVAHAGDRRRCSRDVQIRVESR